MLEGDKRKSIKRKKIMEEERQNFSRKE